MAQQNRHVYWANAMFNQADRRPGVRSGKFDFFLRFKSGGHGSDLNK
jgi:hypothetical protein